MIELFAFACGVHGLPDGCRAVQLDHVCAVFGSAGGDTRDDAVRHGLIAQALVETCDAVLPVRFGERFDDAAALAAAVTPRLRELEERLAAVDGCVELAVRISATENGRATDGAAYMHARLRAATSAAALHALLQEHSRSATVAQSSLIHDACYLVERESVGEFVRRVSEYGAAHPELSFVCTGPWAPASFAEAAA